MRIKDCLKLFALEEIIIKAKPSEIILFSSDFVVAKAINELTKNLGITFIFKKTPISRENRNNFRSIFKQIYFKIPYFLQAPIYLLNYICMLWPLKQTKKIKYFSGENNIIFFSYLFHLNFKKAKNGKFESSQWGPITELLKKHSIKSNWIHHYIPSHVIPYAKTGKNFINTLNLNSNENGVHQFLLQYLNLKIIIKVILNYIKLLFKLSTVKKFKYLFNYNESNINFWPLLKKDFINSIIGPKSIENLLWIELYDFAFKSLPHQEKGFYLQENQPWEKALITSWRNHKHGKLIGLNNGFVRFWDLRFFDNYKAVLSEEKKKMPISDYIILTDPQSWQSYLDFGYPESKLIKAETVRYFDICTAASLKKPNFINKDDKELNNNNKLKAIILGDIVFDTTHNMIKTIEKVSNKNNFFWTLKPHPACPINIGVYRNIKLNITDEVLKDIIAKFDIAIAPAATLSILEAYLNNINAIIFLGSEELNLSPLKGFSDIKFVSDSEEMNLALESKNFKVHSEKKHDLFWFEKDLLRWKKILTNH